MIKAENKEQILRREAVADDLETIKGSDNAPEIISCARRHLSNAQVMQAAFRALEVIWPGYFPTSNALRRALSEVETKRRLASSPLRLVPAALDEMEEGTTYLAATFGVSGVVALVIQGNNPALAEQYAKVFRIETHEVAGKVDARAAAPEPVKPEFVNQELFQ